MILPTWLSGVEKRWWWPGPEHAGSAQVSLYMGHRQRGTPVFGHKMWQRGMPAGPLRHGGPDPTSMAPLTHVLINHSSRGNQSRMESGFEMSPLSSSLIGKGWYVRRGPELFPSPVHRSDSQNKKHHNTKDNSQRQLSLGRDWGACVWAKQSTWGFKVISILKQCSSPWVCVPVPEERMHNHPWAHVQFWFQESLCFTPN